MNPRTWNVNFGDAHTAADKLMMIHAPPLSPPMKRLSSEKQNPSPKGDEQFSDGIFVQLT